MAVEIKMDKVLDKKTLEHKLHIQHRNTRHDACDIVNNYFNEIQTENDKIWSDILKKSLNPDDVFGLRLFNIDKAYAEKKRFPKQSELNHLLMNLKQRKPQTGE